MRNGNQLNREIVVPVMLSIIALALAVFALIAIPA